MRSITFFRFLVAILFSITTPLFAADSIYRTVAATPFSSISVSGPIVVVILPSINAMSGNPRVISGVVDISISQKTLHISAVKGRSATVVINCPYLDRLTANHGAKVTLSHYVTSDRIHIDINHGALLTATGGRLFGIGGYVRNGSVLDLSDTELHNGRIHTKHASVATVKMGREGYISITADDDSVVKVLGESGAIRVNAKDHAIVDATRVKMVHADVRAEHNAKIYLDITDDIPHRSIFTAPNENDKWNRYRNRLDIRGGISKNVYYLGYPQIEQTVENSHDRLDAQKLDVHTLADMQSMVTAKIRAVRLALPDVIPTDRTPLPR